MSHDSQLLEKNATCHRKLNFDFIRSHGRKMPSVKESDFGTGRVGKLQAVTQTVKHTRTKGTVVKGKYHYHEFIYSLNLNIHCMTFLFDLNISFTLML
jgi:hypothetical protein